MRRRPGAADAAADPAVAVMTAALPLVRAGERPLIVDERSGRLAAALAGQGATPEVWLRQAGGSHAARPWPPAGPWTSAFVRLPKAKDALAFALHASAASLAPGAPIAVFGANDEGIRSAGAHLEAVAERVVTVDARRHCRVLAGVRREHIAGLKASLADWRRQGTLDIAGSARPWVSYPGLFAGGGMDEGTALLLDHLPDLAPTARVLDFGCGTGVIGAAVRLCAPEARIDLLDADALALEAARENVPGARLFLADTLAGAGTGRYHAILSNPPLHAGVAEDHRALQGLIADAPRRLTAGGVLQIVVQRRVRASELIEAAFGSVVLVAETGRYRVLRAQTAERA